MLCEFVFVLFLFLLFRVTFVLVCLFMFVLLLRCLLCVHAHVSMVVFVCVFVNACIVSCSLGFVQLLVSLRCFCCCVCFV